MAHLLETRARELARFREVLSDLRVEDATGLAAASVAVRELASFADRVS
jgi:hypothetical protein